jgi:uncharacterized protein YacL
MTTATATSKNPALKYGLIIGLLLTVATELCLSLASVPSWILLAVAGLAGYTMIWMIICAMFYKLGRSGMREVRELAQHAITENADTLRHGMTQSAEVQKHAQLVAGQVAVAKIVVSRQGFKNALARGAEYKNGRLYLPDGRVGEVELTD